MRMMDLDSNGTVELDEVMEFVRKNIGEFIDKQKLIVKMMFEIADVNKSRSLDVNSFETFYNIYTFNVDQCCFDYDGVFTSLYDLLVMRQGEENKILTKETLTNFLHDCEIKNEVPQETMSLDDFRIFMNIVINN